MKKRHLNKKEKIIKRIELRHQSVAFINKRIEKKEEIAEKSTITYKINKKTTRVMNNRDARTKLRISGNKTSPVEIKQEYRKKVFVDYDIVVCIPSHNRYEKIKRLLTQLFEQPTEYTIKVILLNDGSTDDRYDELCDEFSQITYLKNDKPNGKTMHWYCYNQMWEYLKNIECHAVLQMDDDFILCDNFLNAIVDLFFQKREADSAILAIAPHLWSFKKVVEFEGFWKQKDFMDGIALIDLDVIKNMNHQMNPVDAVAVSKPGVTVRTWGQICNTIKIMGGWIYRTEISLAYHNGNDDSKLHCDVRKDGRGGVYTQRYIGKL